MPRGGYQKPKNPAPASGPGRFSKRTDGAIASPDIDRQDLQYGDRSMLEDAQRAARPRGAAGARVPAGERRMTGQPATHGRLPKWFAGTEDTAPDEPTTTGLDMGPGPGREVLDASQPADDVVEVVLEFLATTYGDPGAAQDLAQYRAERSGRAQSQALVPSMPVAGSGLPPEGDPLTGLSDGPEEPASTP